MDRLRHLGRVPALAALAALGLAGWQVLAGCGSGNSANAAPRSVLVTVHTGQPGRRLPPSFLGIATEWDSIDAYAGPAADRRAALRDLLRTVGLAQGSPVALRIGGDSGDQSWWNPQGRPRPRTVRQDLGPPQLDSAAWLARSAGGPVTLGLNLALGDVGNAMLLARQLRRRVAPGQLDTVELGNEPDLYATPLRRWTVPGYTHVRLRKRPDGYGPTQYGREAQRFLRQIPRRLGSGVHVLAGSFAGTSWSRALPRLLRGWHPRPDLIGAHYYAYGSCADPSPGPGWLMAAPRAREMTARLAPFATAARGARIPWRVTEMNSSPCGGRPGMSDAPASALWLADALFALAGAGARQVDVQTFDHARYELFSLAGDGIRLRPVMFGMLGFALAAPTGSRIVPASVAGTGVRARATVGRDGRVRVLLLATAAARVTVRHNGGTCPGAWVATPGGLVTRAPAATAGGCRLTLPASSLAVVGG